MIDSILAKAAPGKAERNPASIAEHNILFDCVAAGDISDIYSWAFILISQILLDCGIIAGIDVNSTPPVMVDFVSLDTDVPAPGGTQTCAVAEDLAISN